MDKKTKNKIKLYIAQLYYETDETEWLKILERLQRIMKHVTSN